MASSPRSSQDSSSPNERVSLLELQVAALTKQQLQVVSQVASLTSRVALLTNQLTEPGGGGEGWERRYKRAKRTGDSVSTIDRQIRAGALEKRVEGRCVYVRDARRPPKPRRKGGRRPVARAPGDDETETLPAAAPRDWNSPRGWPFVKAKEPQSD
jgi:hypothetical protein